MAILQNFKFALRSLARRGCRDRHPDGVSISANASIFSVVRGVLLQPLVNRDESRLVYIRRPRRAADQARRSRCRKSST
jgi:hypothetical protein